MSSSLTIQLAGVMLSLYRGEDYKGDSFGKKPDDTFIELLVTGSVYRSVMNQIYNFILQDQRFLPREEWQLIPLEELDKKKKDDLWERCKKIIAGRLNAEKCIEFCKAIHTLDLISKQ